MFKNWKKKLIKEAEKEAKKKLSKFLKRKLDIPDLPKPVKEELERFKLDADGDGELTANDIKLILTNFIDGRTNNDGVINSKDIIDLAFSTLLFILLKV